jgi:hypothetical protein
MPGLTMLGAAAGVGTGAFGMGLGHHYYNERAKKEYGYNRKMARYGSDLQYEMWRKTNYPAQVKMLKEAGLNPGLMYGMSGGGGTTTGSQTGASVSGGSGAGFNPMDMSNLMLVNAQKKEIESRTSLNKALEKKAGGVDTEVGYASIDKMIQEAKTEQEKQGLLKVQSIGQSIENAYKEEEIVTGLEKIRRETNLLAQEYGITEEMKAGIIMEQMQKGWAKQQEINESKSREKLNDRSRTYMDDILEVKYEELYQGWEKLDLEEQRNEIGEVYNEVIKEMKQMGIDQSEREMWARSITSVIGAVLGFAGKFVESVSKSTVTRN